MLVLLSACDKDIGNPAPPRIDAVPDLPKPPSTIIVPLSVDIGVIEARLNQTTPRNLWAINQYEPKCVPAQRVTVCAVHARKCKGDACKNVPCKVGFKRAKVTPDVACRIVGNVTRGRIGISGRGDALFLSAFWCSCLVTLRHLNTTMRCEPPWQSCPCLQACRRWGLLRHLVSAFTPLR